MKQIILALLPMLTSCAQPQPVPESPVQYVEETKGVTASALVQSDWRARVSYLVMTDRFFRTVTI